MSKKMLIDASHREETRVAIISDNKVEDFDFESASKRPLRGNIYLARITRVEPSLQAAFVEYGGNRHGFLAFSEIHSDYYQIPVSDREALRDAEELEAELARQLTSLTGDLIDEDENDLDDGDVEPALDEHDHDLESSSPRDSHNKDEAPESYFVSEADVTEADDEEASDDGSNEEYSTEEIAESQMDGAIPLERDSEPEEIFADATDALQEGDGETDIDDSDRNESIEKPTQGTEPSLEDRYQQARRDRVRLLKNYRIQEVIKRRQILLIQVVKEERGTKGAALTTYLSLAGRYCVLMPNTARGGGISRKIANSSDRRRLRKAMNELSIPQGTGLIIRTAGSKRTKSEIKRDFDYLLRLWENIRDLTMKSIAPCLIYEEANLIKRAIRDMYDKDIGMITVEGDVGYREAKDFMKMLMPSHAKNVQPYKEKIPLFLNYKVEQQLDEMYQPIVKLKSGGYLVVQQTEALISIDVNSGKATKERNIEATALKTNLEAAQEVARQCRLRDLAGLLVIDFIDMEENRNNRSVEKRLKDSMKQDRARIQFGRISNFGLFEMSRQRRRSGIVDGTTSQCPTCKGAGAIRSEEMAALRILRSIEEEALNGRAGIISASTSPEVALFVLNHKRDWLNRIEETYSLNVEIIADFKKAGDDYEIEKRGPAREIDRPVAVVTADLAEIEDEPDSLDPAASQIDEDEEKPVRKRRRRRRRKSSVDDANESSVAEAEPSAEDTAAGSDLDSETQDDEDDKGARRRRRGRRGGRRNRRRTPADAAETADENSETNVDTQGGEKNNNDAPGPSVEVDGSAETATPTEDEPGNEPALADSVDIESEPDQEAAHLPEAANDPDLPNPQLATATQRDDPGKPKRKGWWEKALGRS